jgi:Cu(I)/Ag(I) efflux system periplasmic protein CusF
MRRIDAVMVVLSGALMASSASAPAIAGPRRASSVRRAQLKTYHAVGTLKSFGPGRAYVNIAHEEIPGYMGAMTMSFWPQRQEQLDGFTVGDHVEFEFTETEDARRVLASIRKRP